MTNKRKTLNKSYENLFNKLYDLETVSLEKIQQLTIASDFFDVKSADISHLKDKIINQTKEVKDLEIQLEKAQEKIAELRKENEFLNEKNSFHVDKMFKFKSQGSKLIESIEEQVEQVKNVIKTKLK